jgi:DNA-binding transcriptional MerR regulator
VAFNVKTTSRLTGIHRSTLLAWERRYGVVRPRRESNGYRIYTREEIARLKRIKSLVDEGYRVSEAVRLLDREGAGR